MAPKRQKRAAEASAQATFGDSSPHDEVEFTTLDAAVEYNRLMMKPVAKERGFLPSLNDGELVAMIQERGWESLCKAPEPVPLAIVREFYANAKKDRDGFSVVRGRTVDYRPEAIRKLIGATTRRRGQEDWVQRPRAEVDLDEIVYELCTLGKMWRMSVGTPSVPITFPTAALNRYAKAWNAFICANIMPSSHSHDVTVDRAILLYGIVTDRYVDLGLIISQGILRFLQGGTTGAIPYGTIVVKLCRESGVRWPETEQVQMSGAPIDQCRYSADV